MWPWEHVAVGYLLYSGYVHLRYGESPGTLPALAVGFGALFPDLVDKPLAWTFELFPSGVSVAHSVFTATALSLAVVVLLGKLGHRAVGTGFSVAYLAHIPADAMYQVVVGNPLRLEAYLWPLVTIQSSGQGGFLDNALYYFVRFLFFLGTPRGLLFLSLEVALLGTTLLVWWADDCPGLGILPLPERPSVD
ncbi:metal-dependent hydrolase [Halomicroarcula sp. F13]|uniref:Metal-dependent hydrolase n=1 Tax=Haloarcula rubra TaxID=2487747 RepID=A0AAW4PUY8_9EURY|nr:metal-dependent hydrolase [Halomicroarcula rubra]MBX0324315.1 metal-dependent hydrolase [Halomicroarcula rubra]